MVESGGVLSQDIGLGRIVGQLLVYLYLHEEELSLEAIAKDLRISKAAVSIATRQLETMGLIRRTWKVGDRKSYYKTADNITVAIQQGVTVFLKQRLERLSGDMEQVNKMLAEANGKEAKEVEFLKKRLARIESIRGTMMKLIDNPILNFFVKS